MICRRLEPFKPVYPSTNQAKELRFVDLFAAVSSSVLSSLTIFLVAALALQIRGSLDFGAAALGAVISLYYLSAAIASVPLSRVVEAIGGLRAMRWGCMLVGLIMLFSASMADSYIMLAVAMACAGAVSSGLQPATNLFIVRRIPPAHYGFAFGIKQAAVPMAVVLGGLAVPAIGLTLGWRWAFVIASALAFVTSAVMPTSQRSLAEYRKRPPAVIRLGRRAVTDLIVLALGFALSVASASALSAFAVTALAASAMDEGTAGLLFSLCGLVAALSRVLVGVHADRGHSEHFFVVTSMLGLGAVAYAALAISTIILPFLLVPGILIAFGAGWGWNGLFNLAVVKQFPTQAARATGITSVGGRIGGVVGPLVFGVIVTHASYTDAWLLAAASAVGGALIMLIGRALLLQHRP